MRAEIPLWEGSPLQFARRVRWALVVLALFVSGAAAAAEGDPDPRPNGLRIAYDLVLIRPLDLVQMATHVVFFPFAYPFSLVAGASASDFVLEACVSQPVDRAFRRPLGEF